MPDFNSALTSGDMTALQSLITSQGLTKEQAASEFGLSPETLNYITGQGVSFSTGSPAPAPAGGLMNATIEGGANGVSTGHYPGVNATTSPATAQLAGGNINAGDLEVARNTIRTGLGGNWAFNGDFLQKIQDPALMTKIIGAARVYGWDDADVAQVLGVPVDQIQSVHSTLNPAAVNQAAIEYGNAAAPTPAPTPAPAPTPPPPAPTPPPYTPGAPPPPAAPAPTPAPLGGPGGGLINAVAVPSAAQAGTPTLNAATANLAAPVVAGQGTAGGYTATQAATAAPVTAGQATATQATSQGYTAINADASLQGPANTYEGAQGTAAEWKPDEQSTVQGQVAQIIKAGSPLQTLADTRSKQQQNAKGLLNSSMAVQAGQTALYDSVMPIATQDANTFATAGQYNAGNKQQMEIANMGSKNQGLEFSAGAKNKVMADNSALQTNVNLANAGETNKAAMFGASEANTTSRFNAQTATQVSQFNVDKALQAGIINQEQANKMAALNAQFVNEASQFNTSEANKMIQFNIDKALQAGIVNQDQANKLSMFNASEANRVSIAQATIASDIAKFNAGESNAMAIAGMNSQTQQSLKQIEGNYSVLLNASTTAASLYKDLMGNVAGILASETMDQAAKDAAVTNLVKLLNSSLGVVGSIANLDLPELDFGGPAPTPAPTPAPAPSSGGGNLNGPLDPNGNGTDGNGNGA